MDATEQTTSPQRFSSRQPTRATFKLPSTSQRKGDLQIADATGPTSCPGGSDLSGKASHLDRGSGVGYTLPIEKPRHSDAFLAILMYRNA